MPLILCSQECFNTNSNVASGKGKKIREYSKNKAKQVNLNKPVDIKGNSAKKIYSYCDILFQTSRWMQYVYLYVMYLISLPQ